MSAEHQAHPTSHVYQPDNVIPLPGHASGAADETPAVPPPVAPTKPAPPGSPLALIPDWIADLADPSTRRHALRRAGRATIAHSWRMPIYAGRLLAYGLRGWAITLRGVARWVNAETVEVRHHRAATTTLRDPKEAANLWRAVETKRLETARGRQMLTGFLLLTCAGLLTWATASADIAARAAAIPAWGWWAAAVVLIAALAPAGRPADHSIVNHHTSPGFTKLTGELTRAALASLRIAGMDNLELVELAADVHRDGPGWQAIANLPRGVTAARVLERQTGIASFLRIPADQVWPEVGEHPGQVKLWVGYQPAHQVKQPVWPWAKTSRPRSLFDPVPFATDPRLRTIHAQLAERNFLFGGQPGSGKTFAMVPLIAAAALDPAAELRGYALKGTNDLGAFERVAAEYGDGIDDATIGRACELLRWLDDECQRRAALITKHKKAGKAPESKVTAQLAAAGIGLHLLVVWIDEVQNLFTHGEHGKEAAALAEKIIRIGRALGVILLLGTQINDSKSVPGNVTRMVSTRMCLAVDGQLANDMILGTGAYKNGYRATGFTPGRDSGWGIWTGADGHPAPVKAFYLPESVQREIVEQAIALRTDAGTLPDGPDRTAATYDLLADLMQVWPAGHPRVANEDLLERLTALRPHVYRGWNAAQLTGALKPHSVVTSPIGRRRDDGTKDNRRGPAQADLHKAIDERQRTSGG